MDSDLQDNPNLTLSAHRLLDFLFELFDIDNRQAFQAELLDCTSLADLLNWLVLIGYESGLQIEQLAMEPLEASESSSPQVPLVGLLANGTGWLVLHGFRSGRVKVTLIQGGTTEEHLLKPTAVGGLLGLTDEFTVEWLQVQPKSPLGHAANPGAHPHLTPMRRLLEVMRSERHDLWLVLGLAMGSGLLALAPPVAVQALVNTVAMGGMGQPLAVLSVILFIFLILSGAIFVLKSYLVELVQRRVFVRLAAEMAYRLPKVRCEVYDTHHGPELVNRFFDVLTVQKAGSSLLLDGVTLLMQAAVGLLLLSFYHPFLLAFDVLLLLSIGFIMFVLGRGAVATAIDESRSKYALIAWLEVVARNLMTFKFDGGPQWAAKRTDQLAHAYLNSKRAHYRVLLRQIIGSVSLYAVANTGLLAIGGYLVINGQLTLGQLVAAELIVSSVLSALIKFGKQLESFYDLLAGIDKIGHLLDLPQEHSHGITPDTAGPAALEVRGLSFGYGSKHPVFEGLNFSVKARERVAVLCRQGGGKSTLAQLLCGLRQPDDGVIKVDGIDLGNLRLDTLRQRIAMVGPMEIVEGTIFENVTINRAGIGLTEVEQALAMVGLHDGLSDWLGTETMKIVLSSNGSPLSTAQARLLTLARAIAGCPALLVLDGFFDDMDELTRSRIMTALFAADAPWTLLVLTRDPDIANFCGRVVQLPVPGHADSSARPLKSAEGRDHA